MAPAGGIRAPLGTCSSLLCSNTSISELQGHTFKTSFTIWIMPYIISGTWQWHKNGVRPTMVGMSVDA